MHGRARHPVIVARALKIPPRIHSRSVRSAGLSALPWLVRRYSTRGGTSAWTGRLTMPSRSCTELLSEGFRGDAVEGALEIGEAAPSS